MAGGANEYVMGNMVNTDGTFSASLSGFTDKNPGIDSKYYDSYTYDATDAASGVPPTYRGHLGDATREVQSIYITIGWNSDLFQFISSNVSWVERGGRARDHKFAGIFSIYRSYGNAANRLSFRTVLTAEDNSN